MPIYRSTAAVTLQTRAAAYDALSALLRHLHAFNLNLLRVQLMGDNFVEVELNNPLSAAQVSHLGLTGPV